MPKGAKRGDEATTKKIDMADPNIGRMFDLLGPILAGAKPHMTTAKPNVKSGGAEQPGHVATSSAITGTGDFWIDRGLWMRLDDVGRVQPVCQEFEIVARIRDVRGQNPATSICWDDEDGRRHEYGVADAELLSPAVLVRRLTKVGLRIEPGRHARAALLELLEFAQRMRLERITLLDVPGWHQNGFVLPDGTAFGAPVRLVAPAPTRYRQRGSLEDWHAIVRRYAPGNSRLILALASAFTGPVLDLAGEDFSSLHFVGPSSIGKTILLRLAASVWGEPTQGDQIRSWHSTGNAVEQVAVQASHTLLSLDEIGQVAPSVVASIVYALGNRSGKGRMGQTRAIWLLNVMSSGERSVEDIARGQMTGGVDVRMPSIPADAGTGCGVFDQTGGAPAAQFARSLETSLSRAHGTAARAFLTALADSRARDEAGLRQHLRALADDAFASFGLNNATEQVLRVAQKLALMVAAGHLASDYGVLPLTHAEMTAAVGRCLQDWLSLRGSPDRSREEIEVVDTVRRYIAEYRFRFRNRDVAPDDVPVVSDAALVGYIDHGDYCLLTTKFETAVGRGKTGFAKLALAKAGYLNATKATLHRRKIWIDRRAGLQADTVPISAKILDDG